MFKPRKFEKAAVVTILALFAAGVTGSAMAESKFNKDHPRRHEVNKRLKNQNKRIHKEVKEGEMSKGQAAQLHEDDRNIRKEERSMAKQDGGYITKQDQHTLNQQENQVGKQIGQ